MPVGRASLTLLTNQAFVVGYDEDRRNPAWVAYRVPGEVRFTEHTRPRRFASDQRTRARVTHDDYTHSGFDRGHMAPSYAIYARFGKEAQRETFLMSNVCPQYSSLNSGRWNQLEGKVAGRGPGDPCWAKQFGQIWVVCGPLYDEERPALASGVAVPSHYFNILLDEDEVTGDVRILAFIMPNDEQVRDPLERFLRSVDEIELRSGYDFFADLDDGTEDLLEMIVPEELWPLEAN